MAESADKDKEREIKITYPEVEPVPHNLLLSPQFHEQGQKEGEDQPDQIWNSKQTGNPHVIADMEKKDQNKPEVKEEKKTEKERVKNVGAKEDIDIKGKEVKKYEDKEKKKEKSKEKDKNNDHNKEKRKNKDEDHDQGKEKERDEEKDKAKKKSKNKDHIDEKEKEKSNEEEKDKGEDKEKKKSKDKDQKDEENGKKENKNKDKEKKKDKENKDHKHATERTAECPDDREGMMERSVVTGDSLEKPVNGEDIVSGNEAQKEKKHKEKSSLKKDKENNVETLKKKLQKLDAKLSEISAKKNDILQRLKEAGEMGSPMEETNPPILHSVEHVTETFKEVTMKDRSQTLLKD